MINKVNNPTIATCLFLAAIITAIAYAVNKLATFWLGESLAFGLVIMTVVSVYCFFLMRYYPRRSGRLVIGLILIVLPCVAVVFPMEPIVAMIIGLGVIWVFRSLIVYKGVALSLLDVVLCALSATVAVICAASSVGLILGIWVFFLLQSLFIYIPQCFQLNWSMAATQRVGQEERFTKAYGSAQTAIERLLVEDRY